MNIVLLAAGESYRFKIKGYSDKQLIEFNDKTILEYMIKSIFSSSDKFFIVLKREQKESFSEIINLLKLEDYLIQEVIIDNWLKKGPAFDLLYALEFIGYEESFIVSYSDFFLKFNYEEYLKMIELNSDASSVNLFYTGYHPHLLFNDDLYGVCEIDDKQVIKKFREKSIINSDRLDNLYSPGIYFFRNGLDYIESLDDLYRNTQSFNNDEVYVSQVISNSVMLGNINLAFIDKNLKFVQLGTPEQLENSFNWIDFVGEKP